MCKQILFLLVGLVLILSGCQAARDNSFALYLVSQDIPASELARVDINQLEIESEPLISSDDIVSYSKTSHSVELTEEASARLKQIFPIPVGGKPFVVCVGKERIYTGAFWTPLSSQSYDGVVILQPPDTTATVIQIALGYPSPDFFRGEDPRGDPRIMKALEEAKKLK
ncbi:MAG: hypothetical protein N3B14_00280 [Thermoleophilia bacterium]|nr:hypothetical protein [Thermoleophilia bacterium]